jgi:hypothetical protein
MSPSSSHVTKILGGEGTQSSPDRPGAGPYTASCLCTWRSDPRGIREESVNAAQAHRANMRVQELV